jgi:serine/threonine protein kinase
MLSPGDRLKDYEIVAPLRAGGMGMLFLARRRGIGGFTRLVALKVVHAELRGNENVQRSLIDEARISAHITHPNVVKVEEAGEANGLYFIAMEYVPGMSLAELLDDLTQRGRRMNPKLCVWLAAQVAEGLRAIHTATGENGAPLQIVHRDVSPQNMLVSRTGHIKLIDFGIADSQQTQQVQGRRCAMLGKLGYMAPEQLQLEAVDHRSDVYGLGVVLWEMLTARRFLRCERIDDERDWAVRRTPPAPSQYYPKVPPQLDRVVLKALAYEPEARFQGALAFRAALLSAVPQASRIDAPALEAVLRVVLDERPDRSGVELPAVYAEPNTDEETELVPAPRLRELMSAMQSPEQPLLDEEEDAEKTLAATPSALRAAQTVAVASVDDYGPVALDLPQLSRLQALAVRAAGMLGLPLLCLLLGTLIGTLAVRQSVGGLFEMARRSREHQAAPPTERARHASPISRRGAAGQAVEVAAPRHTELGLGAE